jgi:hypothetical protein
MSIAPDEVSHPFIPSRMLREVLSWKLASEFHRRHPSGLSIIETHPGGGQYDCLTFIRQGKVLAHLNRVGSFTPMEAPTAVISWDQIWKRGLMEDGIGEVLDQMSRSCGLPVPAKLPSTNRESLTYRVMAGIISSLVFDASGWEWRNGQEDTSGDGNQLVRDRWLSLFPDMKNQEPLPDGEDFSGNTKYSFWFLVCDGIPVLRVTRDAICDGRGGGINLMDSYQSGRRILDPVSSALALIQ